jgi:hypothetical protein
MNPPDGTGTRASSNPSADTTTTQPPTHLVTTAGASGMICPRLLISGPSRYHHNICHPTPCSLDNLISIQGGGDFTLDILQHLSKRRENMQQLHNRIMIVEQHVIKLRMQATYQRALFKSNTFALDAEESLP